MFLLKAQNVRKLRPSGIDAITILRPIALPFLAGLILGSLIGVFSEAHTDFLSDLGLVYYESIDAPFLGLLWHVFRYVLIALFLSAGVLGIVLLPLLSAIRAFSFACSVAVLLQTGEITAIPTAFLSLGVPALLSLPAFFIAVTDAFYISKHFISRDFRPNLTSIPLLRHFLLITISCSAEALYLRYLLSPILGLIP